MTERPATEERGDRGGPSAVALGLILVVIGAALFAAQALDWDIGALGWPLIIVGIGAAILVLGLFVNAQSGMVIGGTVVTAVGLLLLFQNSTGLWATWAYAWALVGPAASGLGLMLWGVRSGDGRDTRNGLWGLLGGLAIFAVGFLFFEGIIGLSGARLPLADWVLPAALMAIGVALLIGSVLRREESR